jgi:hypothetical protein
MIASPPDLEALLVALVLAPATYSRNRFFDLYKDPAVRRARRRAGLVRSIIRHVAPIGSVETGAIIGATTMPSGRVELTYIVPTLGLRRTTTLEAIEAALVRFAMARARNSDGELASTQADEADRQRIEAALRTLNPLAPRSPIPADRQPAVEQDPIA